MLPAASLHASSNNARPNASFLLPLLAAGTLADTVCGSNMKTFARHQDGSVPFRAVC
jgi:hypothetical protein